MLNKRLGEPNEGIEQAIKALAEAQMRDNPHGFYVGNRQISVRTLSDKEAQTALELIDLDGSMLHWRQATSGEKNVANIHGWEIDDWVFAHNGQVFDYAGQTEIKTDSLQMFEQVLRNIRKFGLGNKQVKRAINQEAGEVSFWGRAMLYHKPSDRMFLFGDWNLYLIGKSNLLISSSKLDFIDKTEQVHGMTFESTSGIATQSWEGVGVISRWSKPDFYFKHLGELSKYVPKSNYGYTPSKHEKYDDEYLNSDWSYGYQASEGTKGYAYHSREINRKSAYPARHKHLYQTLTMENEHGERVSCYYGADDQIHDTANLCCELDTCDQFTDVRESKPQPLLV